MSHFTVLVIGDNVDQQLAPYDNSIQTAARVRKEVSEEDKEQMVDYYKRNTFFTYFLPFEELYKIKGNDWNGNSWVKQDGVWVEITTYNPDSKWDWYSVGGRWTGYFKLKPGARGKTGEPGFMSKPPKKGYADIVKKGDIDIESMRNDAGESAGKAYDIAMEIFGDTPVNKTWVEIKNSVSDIEDSRGLYGDQPRVKAWKENPKTKEHFGFFTSPDDFLISKEEYVNNARNSAITPFAVVKDGKWYEKGEMGWWAMVSNEKDQKEWDEQFTKMFDELPDETLLTLVDCHI